MNIADKRQNNLLLLLVVYHNLMLKKVVICHCLTEIHFYLPTYPTHTYIAGLYIVWNRIKIQKINRFFFFFLVSLINILFLLLPSLFFNKIIIKIKNVVGLLFTDINFVYETLPYILYFIQRRNRVENQKN